ncbi:MAG: glycosyltransferase involved in cell wall biosynthesis [Lysobacterales bacterium]|jgi:glycosyltransferase involved in cell wall biosynthesis
MDDELDEDLDIARCRNDVPIFYSIVVPVFNEKESLEILLSEILSVMTGLAKRYEIIFINDGSDDGSKELLEDFKKRLPEIIGIISLLKRAGQTNGLKKGMNRARGEIVVTLDADLQNDPADIERLIARMNEVGCDCVCGWRKARHDSLLKACLSKTGNFLQRLFTGLKIHDVSCTLRAYKQKCALKVPLDWEGQHRFIPLCLSLQGFEVNEIVSNHRDRQYGYSKYSHKRIFRVMSDFVKILKSKGR